jgi:3-dehydroquinate synthase
MKKIKVNLDKKVSNSYDICIGYDILDQIGQMIAKRHPASRSLIVTDSNVSALYGESVLHMFERVGIKAGLIEFPAGEASKNITTVLEIAGKMLRYGADRDSLLIALGGGVVGDMTGLIASLYMRSVPYIQMPTSLMAQVDSSIGGKTAIDLPEGKNLLGTFYQPRAVYIDLKFLSTLSEKEFKNGLAEVIKYGIIEDKGFFRFLEENMARIKNRDNDALERVVENSCRIKQSIVEIDEKEGGLRRVLNFGHTIGHAIESASGYEISHGEAVACGMIAAVGISERLCELPSEDRDRVEHLIRSTGLVCRIPQGITPHDILPRLSVDKKKIGSTIHYVLLKKIGVPFIHEGVPENVLNHVLEELRK